MVAASEFVVFIEECILMLLDQITEFASRPNRDSTIGASLASRAAQRDRAFIKLALRAAGVTGTLPKLKSECVKLLKSKLEIIE